MTNRISARALAEWLFRLALLALAILWVVAPPSDAPQERDQTAVQRRLP